MPRGMRLSAIDKLPVSGPVYVGPLGLAGDEQAERRFHGGLRKAVYAYAIEDLAWWSAELGQPFAPGFIGENVTTEGVDLNALHIDDELTVGEIVLRITGPRDPCTKLAARVGVPGFEKRFGRAGRTGIYCSVANAGLIQTGDTIGLLRVAVAGPSIRDVVRATYGCAAPDG